MDEPDDLTVGQNELSVVRILAAAFGIDRRLDGEDLVRGTTVWLERGDAAASVVTSTRVCIRMATEHPWRFSLAGSPWVSSPVPAASAVGR